MPSHPDRVRRHYDGTDAIDRLAPLVPGSFVLVDGVEMKLRVSRGRACCGFLEDGIMVERVYDQWGRLEYEKRTPFAEWNRI